LTRFVGETSAGKTVFLHNLAYHLAKGEAFLGLTPPRPLRVLYADYESNEEILEEHLTTIGTAAKWEFFDLSRMTRGPALIEELKRKMPPGEFDVLIVDPLAEAYPVKDENDNAQATQQMIAFKELAQRTGAGVVLVHNSGRRRENASSDKFLGRGATARADRADVAVNFTIKSSSERELSVSKSRTDNLGERIIVRFAGELGYELVESSAPSQTVIAGLQEKTVTFVREKAQQGQLEVERRAMMEYFCIKEDTSQGLAFDRALKRNVTSGALHKPRKGVYALPIEREVVNLED
jgi:hypothetical protein